MLTQLLLLIERQDADAVSLGNIPDRGDESA